MNEETTLREAVYWFFAFVGGITVTLWCIKKYDAMVVHNNEYLKDQVTEES